MNFRHAWKHPVLALCIGLAAGVHAAIITVNSTDDSLAVDGNCTLREAIIAANTDAAVDACPAGSGTDTVVVPAGTYTLTLVGADEDAAATGDLDVTASANIVGSPAGAIIDGNGTDRVLDVDPAQTFPVIVTVTNITLRNGAGVAQGGGIRNAGALTLTNSRVSSSTASGVGSAAGGGIYIYGIGSLQLNASTVDGNTASASAGIPPTNPFASGGGIAGDGGQLVIIDSTIRDNGAASEMISGQPSAEGGGIVCGNSVLTLSRSTVSGNGASLAGGGIAGCDGTIVNSTISGNSDLFFDGVAAGGTLTFLNSTISDRIEPGGGTLVFRNSIVAGCDDVTLQGFTTVADDYNLDATDTCQMSGTDLRGVDPMLDVLADNGGPTQTRALLPGSPAIDAGNPGVPGSGGLACEAIDQRGLGRPGGARCDIGAFEVGGSVTTTTTTIPTTTTTATTITTTTTTTGGTTTTTLCPMTPSPGCQPALGGKARLTLKASPDGAKRRLSWTWVSSAAVPEGDFEDPVTGSTTYALCLYDQSGRRLDAAAPAGGGCGRKPCWKRTSSGFLYKDPMLDPDGLKKVALRAGLAAGKAKITVKGKGANLRLPTLSLTPPVRVQMLRHLTPTCWEATFSTSQRNTAEVFTARSDP